LFTLIISINVYITMSCIAGGVSLAIQGYTVYVTHMLLYTV